MKNLKLSWCFMVLVLVHVLHVPVSVSRLAPSEAKILFKVQRFLQYQEPLQGWSNWTNFCYLPISSSLKIVCFNNHVSELTIIGNRALKTQSLPENFSIDSFFTVLTKLSSLKVLSLVSLGLWGPLPAKINRFSSLEVLNISSNLIYGEIPKGIVSMKNLRSLVLEHNLLNGSLPDLKGLVSLEEVNLVGNNLGPVFPSLSNNLVTVKLSSNSFRSVVPQEIRGFDQLQELDVSSNKLIGPFPSFLFSLPSIRYLNVSGNQLSGALPGNTTCSSGLRIVDVSRNLLIGKLPSCVGTNSANRTVVSNWNCLSSSNSKYQHPYSFCHKEALAVKPPAKVKKHESTIKLGVMIGLIGGAVGVIAVVALLVLIIVRRSRSKDAEEFIYEASLADKMSVRSGSVVGNSLRTIDSRRVPQTMRSAAIGLPQYRVFSLEEIEDATNNFDQMNFVGEVYRGQLYKGWLRDGSLVMIKCIKLKQKNSPQSLVQHMEVLSKLRHLHLVSVLGHCIVTYQDQPSTIASTVFIVFEHISNWSLLDYLADWRKKEILKWPQRMAITIGVARGIQFLHTGVAPGIFGNNVKIEHVLLDESLTAKLSNYTIPLPSKTGLESPLHGQEDHNSSENTEKEDVYQLGVILLQVITGQLHKSPSQLEELKAQLQQSMTEGASKLRAMMDPSTRGTYAYESLRNTVDITLNCLSKDARNRPSIEDVLWNLQYSNQVQEGWASSGHLSAQMSF